MGRHAEPAENRSDVGDVEPERSDELAARCVPRINEIIVVPLKEVVAVLDQDDAVQHRLVQHLVLVEDDFAHVIARLSTDDRKVALVQQRVHADAVGDRIGRRPAELRWREEGPHAKEDRSCNDDGGNLRSVRSHEPVRASSAASRGHGRGDADAIRSTTPVSSSRWGVSSRRCY